MVRVYQVDAFTVDGLTKGETGNPAGVVLHADSLSEPDMQRIAAQVGAVTGSITYRSFLESVRQAARHTGNGVHYM